MVLWRTPLARFKVINSLFSHILEGYELNIRISEVVYNLKKGKDLIVPKQN